MRLSILAFACGVLLLQLQGALPALPLVGMMALVAAIAWIWAGRQRYWVARGVAVASAVVLGFSWAAWRAQVRLSDDLPAGWEVRDIALTGVVAALPQRFERGERFEFDVESVQTPGARVPGRILLSWYHDWDELDDPAETFAEVNAARAVRPGERWQLTVRLKRPHGNANPHGFDYEAWLLERNIRATGTIRPRGENVRTDAFVVRPGYGLERLRDSLRQQFHATLPGAPYLGVLVALTMGDQRAIPAAQWTIFNRTGVSHLVSISGLHVTMVAALFAALVNALWRCSTRAMLWLPAQQAAVIAGWLAALAYALIAGFEVPAQRTLYMLSVVALAMVSGRNIGTSRTLLLALLVVVLLDPWAVLSVGFWLSFGAVAILFYVSAARLFSGGGWRASIRQWGLAQWAVTVGSLPLLLFFFQQFSLVSPLANALAIPWVSFLVTPLALLFAVLPWPPLLAADHWLLAQLMVCLDWLAGWPVWQQPAPPLWASMLALVGVAWLLLPRGFPARWTGIVLMLPAFALEPERPATDSAWIEVLDVGQGLAVVVRTANHALLYDTGPAYSTEANAGQRVVLPYLRAIGVNRLDALVVSHRDKDHAGGAAAIRQALPVERLLTSALGNGGEPCVADQSWEWDGVRFSVLHPLAVDYDSLAKKPNNLSCVLRIEAAGRVALLTADIEAKDEAALLARDPVAVRSDVIVVPHHGGRGSSTPAFVATVGASDAVFSAGYRNSFGHPRSDILERYAASRRWRTDRDGAIRVKLAASPVVSAWRNERRRYWHDASS